jgi:peptidoglycan/xylan/chitin deacetylase (PgdA/CDA1 family)
MIPKILLSFDVEEFDMPLEYQFPISEAEQMAIGKKGLDAILPILNDEKITTTLFTTANFATQFSETIKTLSDQHEIASHTYYHSSFETKDLLNSRLQLSQITQKNITGLRMPRMKQVPIEDIVAAGYTYDASIHPTWLPGRYNNLHLPRTIYTEHGIKRIPASVSPHCRIPLFWLSFKNFPYALYQKWVLQTLKKDGYVSLYFHPWEFVDINRFGLPKYTTKGCEGRLLEKLHQLVQVLKKYGEFQTMQDFSK